MATVIHFPLSQKQFVIIKFDPSNRSVGPICLHSVPVSVSCVPVCYTVAQGPPIVVAIVP